MRRALTTIVLAALSTGGCRPQKPCDGAVGVCIQLVPSQSEAEVRAAFAASTPGSTIAFAAGAFHFTGPLTISTAQLTVQGMGDGTVLEFSQEPNALDSNGIAVAADGVHLRSLSVADARQSAIVASGVSGLSLRNLAAKWSNADPHSNGGWGIRVIQSSSVLIDGCSATNARNAGIDVRQSSQVVVRGNTALANGIGIDVFNSSGVDVLGNTTSLNTAGIVVGNLWNLAPSDASGLRVVGNDVHENNLPDIATESVAQKLPSGTGLVVLAGRSVELIGNQVTRNRSLGVAVLSLAPVDLGGAGTLPGYEPTPARVYVHDGSISGNGNNPDGIYPPPDPENPPPYSFGNLLAAVLPSSPLQRVPGQLIDGSLPADAGPGDNPTQLCFHGNATGDGFVDLHFDQLGIGNNDIAQTMTFDAGAYTCQLAPLPAVQLPADL